jgi:hypothetical protein
LRLRNCDIAEEIGINLLEFFDRHVPRVKVLLINDKQLFKLKKLIKKLCYNFIANSELRDAQQKK